MYRHIRAALIALALAVLSTGHVFAQSQQQGPSNVTSATCPGTGCVSLSVSGFGAVAVQVRGTYSGTLSFEGSVDGSTWVAINLLPIAGTTAVSTTTGTGVWNGGVGGLSIVRVRMSSYTSGTAVVTIKNAPSAARGGGSGGGGGGGTVSSIGTTSPITGGTITTTGTIACATCGVTTSPLSQFASTTSAQLAAVLSDETGTGANVFATSPTITTPQFSGTYRNDATVNDGNSGTADTIDWSAGNVHYSTLTGNVTYTFSNPGDSSGYVLFINTGAGSFTATWPASVKWFGGVAPTITTTASRVDVVVCRYLSVSTAYFCSFSQNATP